MTIPSVMQGLIETEDGKVFELDSPKGSAWLESIGSFRFEPSGDNKPYTVRKESGIYWYGCRKVAGKVRKKYIGKSSEVTVAKLEEIAEALEIPPVPRANKVAEVVQVAEGVTEVAQDRLTALELQVANLQKAIEALQEALPGKLESGDSLELPKVDNEVAEQLQNELGNLRDENERLDAEYTKLLASSSLVTEKLREEVQKLRSQLEKERADREEIETELSDLKQKSAATSKDLPEAADLLNQLKAKRKKSTTALADVEKILEIIEGDGNE
jgi:chromosome segregation ATPase